MYRISLIDMETGHIQNFRSYTRLINAEGKTMYDPQNHKRFYVKEIVSNNLDAELPKATVPSMSRRNSFFSFIIDARL